MARPTVVLDLAGNPHKLARDLVAGGVFVPGCALAVLEDCELVVRGGAEQLTISARVVFVDASGAGLELVDCPAETMQRLVAMTAASAVDSTAEEEDEADEASARKIPLNVHERLRGLTLVQQVKLAQTGEVSERIVLERIYGKTVWEALLRNPRITGPEVARIARMGALPRPLVEMIVNNGGWLQIPEIRRSLLTNPRLGTDQVVRVLRLLPKHELKLAASSTGYTIAVRDAAKRLIKDNV